MAWRSFCCQRSRQQTLKINPGKSKKKTSLVSRTEPKTTTGIRLFVVQMATQDTDLYKQP